MSVALAVAGGCDDTAGPSAEVGPQATLPEGLSISESVFLTAPGLLGGSGKSLAYLAASPGTFPEGLSASITNLASGESLSVEIIDGGFDPVVIPASTGDELVIGVLLRDGTTSTFRVTVPRRKRPRVVRTRPPKGQTDVVLNSAAAVVFSEPVDPGTINSETIELRAEDGAVVAAALMLSEDGLEAGLFPDDLLVSRTTYELRITTGVTDLDGDQLEDGVVVTFTTGEGTAPVASVTVSPDNATLFAGGALQLEATAWDAQGGKLAVRQFEWSTSNDTVVTVSSIGNVDAVGPGFATVSATAGGKSASASITVVESGPYPIVFESNRTGSFEIYTTNESGSVKVNLTGMPGWDTGPAWSPDGSKVAFTSNRDGDWDVYVMDEDGTNQVRLTNSGSHDFHPAWSPDGAKIAFASGRDGNWEIYVVNADGSGLVNVTESDDAHDWSPTWSPDGRRIAFSSNRDGDRDIHVIDLDGAGQLNLTASAAIDDSPAWSPDGLKIAFVSDRDGNNEIYVINADGSDPVNLTNHLGPDADPSWSPDGSKIVFASWRGDPVTGDPPFDIYIMNANNGAVTRLTTHSARDAAPAWRPVR